MRMRIATPISELDEKQVTSQVVGTKTNPGLARIYGWTCYHTLRSKGSEAGFPDWTLARDRVVFLELKTEKGQMSDAQKHWFEALLKAGAEAWLVRPRNVDAISKVLGARHDQHGGFHTDVWPALDELRRERDLAMGVNQPEQMTL